MSYSLTAEPRPAESKLSAVRESKLIPGVLYGAGVKENQSLQLNTKDFNDIYEEAGESQVVELELAGKKHNIIVRDVQIDPVTREPIHVDLYAIDINKPVEVDIPFEFTGVAPAVKASGGSLMKQLDSLSVKCLPKDLVKSIEVPLGKLETVEDNITVADLKIPEGMEIMADESEMVATVVPPRIEAAPETAEPEAGAEGEATAEGEQAGGDEAKPESADSK